MGPSKKKQTPGSIEQETTEEIPKDSHNQGNLYRVQDKHSILDSSLKGDSLESQSFETYFYGDSNSLKSIERSRASNQVGDPQFESVRPTQNVKKNSLVAFETNSKLQKAAQMRLKGIANEVGTSRLEPAKPSQSHKGNSLQSKSHWTNYQFEDVKGVQLIDDGKSLSTFDESMKPSIFELEQSRTAGINYQPQPTLENMDDRGN